MSRMSVSRSVARRNILRGLIPSVSNFDAECDMMNATPATNLLANATDGNYATSSAVGSKALSSNSTVGLISYDLGTVRSVLFKCRCNAWSGSGSITAVIQTDEDTNYSVATPTLATATSTSEDYNSRMAFAHHLVGRYIRLKFATTGSSGSYSAYVRLKDCAAYIEDW
jgi:hypothetical protein